MARSKGLTHDDLRRFSKAVFELYSLESHESPLEHIPSIVKGMVESDSVAIWSVCAGHVLSFFDPTEAQTEADKMQDVYLATYHTHPFAKRLADFRDKKPFRVTDEMNHKQYQKTQIYNEFLSPLGIEHQVSMSLDLPMESTGVLTLNHGRQIYSDEQVLMLELLNRHISRIYSLQQGVVSLSASLDAMIQVAGNSGKMILLVDDRGKIITGTRAVCSFVELSFGSLESQFLPEKLKEWFTQELLSRKNPSIDCPGGESRYWPTRQGKIRTTLHSTRDPRVHVIIFDLEKNTPTIEEIMSRKFTRRHAEIIHWMIQGKTSGEIAIILGISRRTVEKHLENIFSKLNVTNRAQAVAAIFE